jgi:DNA-cytosine methyltransferase
MSYGFASVRQSHMAFKVLAGLDIDGDALRTYERNVGAPGIKMDVRLLAEKPEKLAELVPEISEAGPLIFIGCPPCQGFSALRKGDDRDDHRNDLASAFATIVGHYKPDVFVIENVAEMLSGRFSDYFRQAEILLEDAEYKLAKDVLDLSLYGVPQRRKRAVVLGSLKGKIALPEPPFATASALTVRHAIGHLRPLQAGEEDPIDSVHRAPAHTPRLVNLFKLIPPDGGDRRSLPAELQLPSHAKLDAGSTPGFTDVYGRLRWDTPSVTITAKSRSPSSGRFLHPEQHRNISIREAALLQGFPHTYVFDGTPTQQYRQIGEAVPPIFARSVAWTVLDHLAPNLGLVPTMPRPKSRKKPTKPSDVAVVDLFCGAGGFALGLAAAGFRPAFACDINEAAVASFRRNISQDACVADVDDPNFSVKLASVVGDGPWCAVGGPPCQGFSHQRRGQADDARNALVVKYAKVLLGMAVRPSAIVLENVTDLDLPRGREVLRAYVSCLESEGYTCFRHDLNSADYGVPQLRNRIIVVALVPEVAARYDGPVPLTPGRWVTVGEALGGLPDAGTGKISNHEPSAEGPENRRRIAFVDMGHGRKAVPADLQLPCHAGNYRGHRDVFGRLDWYSQARTITSGFDSFTRGEYGHPFQHRSITAREAARIQGFPDWFVFEGNRAQVRRQIGNAVPPPLAFSVGLAVLTALQKAALQWAA